MSKLLSEDRPLRDRLVLSVLTILVLFLFWAAVPEQFQANQNYDYNCCYETAARDWMDGLGFVYPNGNFASAYPPGFPAVLVAQFTVAEVIGERPAFLVFTILCDLATVFGLYAAGRLLGGFWIGRLAALALITYPFFLWLSKQPNSEVPFLPCLVWAFYGYLRLANERDQRQVWKWAAFTGLMWGLATLVRPIALFTPLITGGCYLLCTRNHTLVKRLAAVCLLLAASAATLIPWEVGVHSATGRWILVAEAGNAYWEGVTFGLPSVALSPVPVSDDILDLMQRADDRAAEVKKPVGLLKFLAGEAMVHPATFVRFMMLKATRVWYATHEQYFEDVNMIISLVYVLAAGFGFWKMRRSMTVEAVGILAIVGYFWVMATLVFPLLRYMIPGFTLMMLAIAVMLKGLIIDRWLPCQPPLAQEEYSRS